MQDLILNQVLVEVKNGELLISSLVIADNVLYEHETVTRLIKENINDFEEFGTIEFMDLKSENSTGGRPQKIVLLNENQSTLLITYMRNNDIIKRFKINLIKAFSIMKEQLQKQYQRPLTINEQIILIAQGHQEVEQRLTQIEHKIENDITLTSAQKFHLKETVTKKVFEIKNNHNLDDSFTKKNYQRIWKKLKNHFIVSSYMEIPKSKFDEALNIVKNVSFGDLI